MDVAELLSEMYGRIPPLAERAVAGLTADQLALAPEPGRNSIAWLVWHLARVQDSHIAELLPADQLWTTGNWPERMWLPADPHDTGYGHTPEQVATIRPPDGTVLLEYLAAVAARTRGFLDGLKPADLERVVDRRWHPPVSLGVRLVSVADDCLQHAGQAAYVRGWLGA
jgi:hypothetical protein